jgi:hypothetical protein
VSPLPPHLLARGPYTKTNKRTCGRRLKAAGGSLILASARPHHLLRSPGAPPVPIPAATAQRLYCLLPPSLTPPPPRAPLPVQRGLRRRLAAACGASLHCRIFVCRPPARSWRPPIYCVPDSLVLISCGRRRLHVVSPACQSVITLTLPPHPCWSVGRQTPAHHLVDSPPSAVILITPPWFHASSQLPC